MHTNEIAQVSGCDGKQAFESRSLASKVANRSNKRHDTARVVYGCPYCGKYHIGTNSNKRR